METVYEQDKFLANDFLNRNFYQFFQHGLKKIELFITGACKANCDYCYLKKNQKDLYPIALQKEDIIIKNLQLVLDWYVENKFNCVLDIFSAEWLTTPIADKVFDCFYNTFKNVEPKYRPKLILCADNMQFLKDDEATEKIKYQIERLRSLGIDLPISASIDGKYCDYGRTENDDEFYLKLNDFMEEYNLLMHPMISSDNIKYQIENNRWFTKTFSPRIAAPGRMMTLEVRDNSWNEESISQLIQYCDYLTDTVFNYFEQDKERMLRFVLKLPYKNNNPKEDYPSYDIIGLNPVRIDSNDDDWSCSMSGTLCIRLGDLSVAPCHRQFYDELLYGHFNVEDNKIKDFEPKNLSLFIANTHLKKTCSPHCENCKFVGVCIGYCQGAAYETYNIPWIPPINTCKMYRAKLTFLIYKYYLMGLWDILPEVQEDISEMYYLYLEDLIYDVLGGLADNVEG